MSEGSVRSLALADWHLGRGARMVVREIVDRGFSVPASYGAPDRKSDREHELAELRSGVALVDRSHLARLEVLGADRQRFINGLCTVNVPALEAGSSAYGFVTDKKGRVLADVTVLAHPDRLWLVLPAGRGQAIHDHLSRFIVADQVEVLPLDELLPLALVGASCTAALVAAGVEAVPDLGKHSEVELLDSRFVLDHHLWQRVEAFTLWVPASIASMVASELVDDFGAHPAGLLATETLRVEETWPEFGIDYTPDNLPQETGLESAVDYQKGCYLGQEVIARLHYRGQAARRIGGLAIEVAENSPPPQPGAKLALDGRTCGTVTSVADSARLGGLIGLAMIQRRVEADHWLELEGGGRARLR